MCVCVCVFLWCIFYTRQKNSYLYTAAIRQASTSFYRDKGIYAAPPHGNANKLMLGSYCACPPTQGQ